MDRMRSLYKLKKYVKLGKSVIREITSDKGHSIDSVERKIDKSREYLSKNPIRLDYYEDVEKYLGKMISEGSGFEMISRTFEYKLFYEIKKLENLYEDIFICTRRLRNLDEFTILMGMERFSRRFELVQSIFEWIEDFLKSIELVDRRSSDNLHHSLLNLRKEYLKSPRKVKTIKVLKKLGNEEDVEKYVEEVEVKINHGPIPNLKRILTLPYNYKKHCYTNGLISISCKSSLDSLPNRKRIVCGGSSLRLSKTCILDPTGEVLGMMLITYKLINCGYGYSYSYHFSEGSVPAIFGTRDLKSILE